MQNRRARTRYLSSADLNRAAFQYDCSNDYSLHPSVCIGHRKQVPTPMKYWADRRAGKIPDPKIGHAQLVKTQATQDMVDIVIEAKYDPGTSNRRPTIPMRGDNEAGEGCCFYQEQQQEETNQKRRGIRQCKKTSGQMQTQCDIQKINIIEQTTDISLNNKQSSFIKAQSQYYERHEGELNKCKRDRRLQRRKQTFQTLSDVPKINDIEQSTNITLNNNQSSSNVEDQRQQQYYEKHKEERNKFNRDKKLHGRISTFIHAATNKYPVVNRSQLKEMETEADGGVPCMNESLITDTMNRIPFVNIQKLDESEPTSGLLQLSIKERCCRLNPSTQLSSPHGGQQNTSNSCLDNVEIKDELMISEEDEEDEVKKEIENVEETCCEFALNNDGGDYGQGGDLRLAQVNHENDATEESSCCDMENPYICGECDEMFTDQTRLQNHLLALHAFACDLCDKCFITLSALKGHLTKHNGNGSSVALLNHNKDVSVDSPCDIETPYICGECEETFLAKSELYTHLLAPHAFTCDLCDKCFITTSALKDHLTNHSAKPSVGQGLSGVFIQDNTHANTVKVYSCRYCRRFFSQIRHYAQHIQIHTRKVQLRCNICKESFEERNELVRHLYRHKRSNSLQHTDCDVCVSLVMKLEDHNRNQHLKGNPFKCRWCGNAYASVADWLLHENDHTEPQTDKSTSRFALGS